MPWSSDEPIDSVWDHVAPTTWRSQVLGPRWEAVVRAHVAPSTTVAGGPIDVVGATRVADRTARANHEVDLVAVRGGEVVALGEAKLRRLRQADLDRLRRIRGLLGAESATIVLASAEGVDAAPARAPDVMALRPADIYG